MAGVSKQSCYDPNEVALQFFLLMRIETCIAIQLVSEVVLLWSRCRRVLSFVASLALTQVSMCQILMPRLDPTLHVGEHCHPGTGTFRRGSRLLPKDLSNHLRPQNIEAQGLVAVLPMLFLILLVVCITLSSWLVDLGLSMACGT